MNINELKRILKSKKLTQKEFADQIGMSKTGLNQILKGNVNPKLETIEKIAAALGVQLSLLLSPGPVNVQNGHINIVGDSQGKIKHLTGSENIYTTSAEIESMKKEIEGLRELVKSKDETIASLKMTIDAIRKN